MIIKLAVAMVIVFIILPLLILGMALIAHLTLLAYFELKEDIEELRANEKR